MAQNDSPEDGHPEQPDPAQGELMVQINLKPDGKVSVSSNIPPDQRVMLLGLIEAGRETLTLGVAIRLIEQKRAGIVAPTDEQVGKLGRQGLTP